MLPVTDRDGGVRSAAYQYLGAFGDDEVRAMLENLKFGDDSLSALAADDAAFSISLRLRPVETLTSLIGSSEYVSDKRMVELEPVQHKVTNELLLKGIESQWASVRKSAGTELARRGAISRGLAIKLTEDPSIPVREIGFRDLARRAESLNFEQVRTALSGDGGHQNTLATLSGLYGGTAAGGDADGVICAYFREKPELALQSVDWFSLEGTQAYRSLALYHYDQIHDVLRPDLQNGFERIRQLSISKIKRQVGDAAGDQIVERFKHLDDFVRSRYIEAALDALAIHGELPDVKFGRQNMSSGYSAVKLAAVRVVSRFGSDEDSAELLKVAKDGWGELRDEAGAGALRLSSTPFETALELSQSQSNKIVQTAFGWLFEQDSREVRDFFRTLLNSEDETRRLRAVYYLSKRLKTRALSKLLGEQFEREKYYYNVVAWLDRLLYSPRALRRVFVKELEREPTLES